MRVFGVNGLVRFEVDVASANSNALGPLANEAKVDSLEALVVEREMLELVEIEVPTELAVDSHQQVQVELGGDACRIVVGPLDHVRIFHEVDSDEQATVPSA